MTRSGLAVGSIVGVGLGSGVATDGDRAAPLEDRERDSDEHEAHQQPDRDRQGDQRSPPTRAECARRASRLASDRFLDQHRRLDAPLDGPPAARGSS